MFPSGLVAHDESARARNSLVFRSEADKKKGKRKSIVTWNWRMAQGTAAVACEEEAGAACENEMVLVCYLHRTHHPGAGGRIWQTTLLMSKARLNLCPANGQEAQELAGGRGRGRGRPSGCIMMAVVVVVVVVRARARARVSYTRRCIWAMHALAR